MRLSTGWRYVCALSIAIPLTVLSQATAPPSQAATGLTQAEIQRLAQNPTQRVMVILRNQHSELIGAATKSVRTSAIGTDQAGIIQELQAVGAPRIQPFHLINAVGATISQAEVAHLKANPLVQAVVPDVPVLPIKPLERAASESPPGSDQSLRNLCGTAARPSLEPEALQVTHTAYNDPFIPQAQNLVTGTGVTVAFIADGLDIHNPDFIRPDGTSVFTDYQDFNGDGPNAPTGGGEAFGDASSIAAQGRVTYDANAFANSAQKLPIPCPIRILGMAPGASLMGLKVFGKYPAFISIIVQAVQYAVDHGANVINESLGENIEPDNANDPFALANDAAVADGVVVTASTGDAATAGTIGTPATDPNVIAVGATTTQRSSEQVGYPGTGRGTGWVDNNIASFSSGGFAQSGQKTVDVVAPGQDNWALCSTDVAQYSDCTSFDNQPSPIQNFGGTSESAPLTAGEAALIIQAYRQTHGNVTPSPALVKQIIVSTATDLHLPGYEQGAGLIDSLKAVQAALSIADGNGRPQPRGATLLYATHPGSPSTLAGPLTAQDLPGTPETFPVQITNTGARLESVHPLVRMLQYSAPRLIDVTLDPGTATPFTDGLGRASYATSQLFSVPARADYLKLAVAWDVIHQPHSIVRVSLYDPSGRFVLYSNPQGSGSGYGDLEVHDPQPGTWKAVVWSVAQGSNYSGTVHLAVTTSHYALAGLVLPASVTLAPGQSTTLNVHLTMPAQAGDASAEVMLPTVSASGVSTAVIPIILRTLVPTSSTGGTFTGLLTGGNGRPGAPGQTLTYAFRVPAGLRDVDLGIVLQDSNYNLGAVLVDPSGQDVDAQSTVTAFDQNATPTAYTNTLQFFRRDPQPGLWRLVLIINLTTSGQQTEEPFIGKITFNGVQVTATGVPNSPGTTLVAGAPVTIPVTVTNTGNETENYFVDARLAQQVPLPLTLGVGTAQGAENFFAIPPESTQVSAWAETTNPTVPFNLELNQNNGTPPYFFVASPDLLGTPFVDPTTGNYGSVASYSSPEVPPGFWFEDTAELGPFGNSGAPTSTVIMGGSVVTELFDSQVSSSTGDLWFNQFGSSAPYTPLTLAPGQTGTITVTFTPHGRAGAVVQGYLYVDTLQVASGFITTGTGDELIRIPYSYTIR